MNLVFSPSAKDFLQKIDLKNRDFLRRKIFDLAKLKNPLRSPNVLKIKLFNFYRFRAGDFRIFFKIKNDEILIGQIRRRNEKNYR